MDTNRLIISGIIDKIQKQKISPTGIPHCEFILKHFSKQQEAGFYRHVMCRINIIASGTKLLSHTLYIKKGNYITVIGFIHNHKNINGLNNLKLHANQIKIINLGDKLI